MKHLSSSITSVILLAGGCVWPVFAQTVEAPPASESESTAEQLEPAPVLSKDTDAVVLDLPAHYSSVGRVARGQRSWRGGENSNWGEVQLEDSEFSLPSDPHALEQTRLVYRRMFGNERTSVGLGLGTARYQSRSAGFPSGGSEMLTGAVPIYNVSLQQRLAPKTHLSLDIWSNQNLPGTAGNQVYETRWKLEYRPTPQSGFGFARGAINFRFDSKSVMSLRLRRGGPMLYYRAQF